MPLAVEQFDLAKYDLIISSSHAVAKGVITGPDQLHICYCHSPIRYAWDMQGQYLKESGLEEGLKGLIVRYLLYKIRNWDYRTANGVDFFISNSDYIGRRIKKIYRRDSTTIYPNVNVDDFELHEKKEDFYLTASRMVPYKKIDLIVKAFKNMPDKKLIVIGDGPQMNKVRSITGNNINILGYQSFDVLRDHLQRAKGFVFAAEEDFGIIPVEAQACGTPVIAYGKGGALETIIDGKSGVFFYEQTELAIQSAIEKFESNFKSDPKSIRQNAMRFSTERFKTEFKLFVDKRCDDFFN
jgi:glycosyltransferase involved in cell wall biosynthesis